MAQVLEKVEAKEIIDIIARTFSKEIAVLPSEISHDSTLRQAAQKFYAGERAYQIIGRVLAEISREYNFSIPTTEVERVTFMKPNELADYVNRRISG